MTSDVQRDLDDSADFLEGGGEMRQLIRSFDWSRTLLGPAATWPRSLKIAVRIMLDSRYAMWLGWGPELTFFYNDAYGKMTLGPKHPWALGRPAREVWAEIWQDIGPRTETVIRTGQATWDEGLLLFLQRRGFAEETYHTFSYSPLPDDRGGIGGMLCVVTEDTERTIAERRLRTLRELAVRTLHEASSPVAACEEAARILNGSPRDLPFVLLYLATADGNRATLAACTGMPVGTALSPATIDVHARRGPWPLAEVAIAGKAMEVVDSAAPAGSDDLGWGAAASRCALVLPMSGPSHARPFGFVVAGVSKHRPLDDEYRSFLELATTQIASGVDSARAFAAERHRAEKLAELDRAKTAFFSNVSHEFRTPLTLMLGPVEDLRRDEALPATVSAQLEVVHRNGLRLLRLVNTLLDFSRIEAGRVRAAFQPTDLGAFTAELASNFRSACERAGLRFDVDSAPLDEPAFVDRDMWEKVVLNLLSNAFKFTFTGGIAVSLQRSGQSVELRVQDTGTGIPADEMPRLFERFHRVENAKGRTHEGSGIGLALVQELVRLHGGAIKVDSVFGEGSSFVVTLPLGSSHLPADQIIAATPAPFARAANPFLEEALRWLPETADGEARSREEAEASATAGATAMREGEDSADRPYVLVADDNADMRQYVVRLLAEHFHVGAVADGEAALAAVQQRTPDLVLSDVMMPRLDGFGLLRSLRADDATRNVPVIMLSARAGGESRVEGVEAGADDYLIKPFSARELLARVSAQLQMARMRTAANESLRQSAERLRMALAAARMVAWQLDPASGQVALSDNAVDVLGLRAGTILEREEQAFALLHPDDLERHRATVLAVTRERGSFQHEYRIVRPDNGAVQWMEDRGHAVASGPGGAVRLVGVVMDISERKQAEAQRRQAEEALREASRKKDEFLATLAHELRNPLAPLSNGLQMLRLTDDRARLDDVRAMMDRQLTQMIRLVDDLMDVSRITRDMLELRTRPVALQQVLASAIETSRPLIESMGHQLTVAAAEHDIVVDADLTRLAQAFLNLINNAAKYSEAGGHIRLSTERRGSQVVVSVADKGIGIPPDQLPRIFDMFTQIDRSLARSQGGLGIGLTLVKRLVEMHGGTVEAKSGGPGKGSEFVVCLPIHGSSPAIEQEQVVQAKTSAALRILIVDDNADSARSLAMVLQVVGNDTRIAYDGEAAIATAAAYQPDVILLDLGLPKMTGFEACRRIRAQVGGEEPIVIAQTGWGQESDRERTKAAGFDHHLVKPVDLASLMKVLGERAARKS